MLAIRRVPQNMCLYEAPFQTICRRSSDMPVRVLKSKGRRTTIATHIPAKGRRQRHMADAPTSIRRATASCGYEDLAAQVGGS